MNLLISIRDIFASILLHCIYFRFHIHLLWTFIHCIAMPSLEKVVQNLTSVCPNPNLIHRRKRLFRTSIPLSRLPSLPIGIGFHHLFFHWNVKPSISLDFLLFGNSALSIQRYCLKCDVKIESILHFFQFNSGKPRDESNARIIAYYYLHRKG